METWALRPQTLNPSELLHLSNSSSDTAIRFEQGGMTFSVTFAYTGSPQTWTVPPGITSIQIDARGASGGDDLFSGDHSGKGARVQTTLQVTPGETLYI